MVHHNFSKGTKVLVILQDGTQVVDKYVDSKGNFIILENHRYKWQELRSVTIYKEKGRKEEGL